MAEDYLTDDEQLEQVKRVIQENWVWVAAGVVLAGALVFGYRYHEGYQNARALRAAAQFGDMSAALERNDRGKSRQIAAGLIESFPASPYADQAQMVLARLDVDDGRPGDAAAPLTRVMTDSKDGELRRIARLRLARLLIDQGKADEALKTLTQDGWGAFAARAHEVRGDAYYAKHDSQNAVAEYKAALLDGDSGSVNTALVQLKLADLATPPPSLPVKLTAADPTNKAKP